MAISKRALITGALTLTIANVITRLIGFAYRIFMAGAIGPEGMGMYQLIMLIYSLAWAISCSGITTTLSRLVAAEQAKGEYGNMRRLLRQSLLITSGIAALLTVVLFFSAELIAVSILNDGRLTLSLRILSAAIVFMAAGSCIRGYFLGLQKAAIPAASQVIEQLARMTIILMLAGTFIPRGLEYASAAAVIGIAAGEALSFAYVYVAYRRYRRGMPKKVPLMTQNQALFAIMAMATPLTLNRISSSFLSTVENVLIPQRLQLWGYSAEEAMAVFGKITGMAMPLIFFPSAILTALSISLVPSISEAVAMGQFRRVNSTISKSIVFTSIIAFGAGLIFVVFPYEIGNIVYNQDLGMFLLVLGLMCPFWYLNITLSGVLNGLGEQVFIFRNSLLASLINIAFTFFLVPIYGVWAFLVGWLAGLIIITVFDIVRIRKVTDVAPQMMRWFAKPALAATAAGLVINFLHNRYFANLGEMLGVVFSLALLMGLYAVFIVLLGTITIKDIREMMSFRK
ncbi:MAG: polysaccharide biosynthesis protein [Defluviitaleaceae bacterium]|nr:polysaccharide biosynthesis protein [Defluviitaleaceae bacterium]